MLPVSAPYDNREVLFNIEDKMWRILSEILVAPIKGDVETVHGINTNIATILDERTPLAKIWSALFNTISKHLVDKYGTEEYYWTILGAASLVGAVSKRSGLAELFSEDRYRSVDFSSRGQRVNKRIRELWNASAKHIRGTLCEEYADLKPFLEMEVTDLIGDHENWFDATQYWWDWFGEKAGY